MNRFLAVFALLCCGAMSARADGIGLAPPSQTLPVSTTATVSGPIFFDFCLVACFDVLSVSVLSGPDAGYSLSFLAFNPVELSFVIQNNGTPGTDTVMASLQVLSGGPPLTFISNSVDITWTSASTSVPEPSVLLLLLCGMAGFALLRRLS